MHDCRPGLFACVCIYVHIYSYEGRGAADAATYADVATYAADVATYAADVAAVARATYADVQPPPAPAAQATTGTSCAPDGYTEVADHLSWSQLQPTAMDTAEAVQPPWTPAHTADPPGLNAAQAVPMTPQPGPGPRPPRQPGYPPPTKVTWNVMEGSGEMFCTY